MKNNKQMQRKYYFDSIFSIGIMILSMLSSFASAYPTISKKDTAIIRCDSLLSHKISDNRGNAPLELKGVRNLRVVLNDVLYRSGANNIYNPFLSRANNNPVSLQTLLNLYESGFDKVYYLYRDNFNTAYTPEMINDLKNIGITYTSMVPTNDSLRYLILSDIYKQIKSPGSGAILLHCWNGWHMSGMISALALRQFCDFSPQKAWTYWQMCTDGNDKGFNTIRERIINFTPYESLRISPEEKKRVCPCKM